MQPCRRGRLGAPGPALDEHQHLVIDADDGIADNFQTFLTLLTTQLQNQNPLDPLDTNQFTQQLVQFAASSSSSIERSAEVAGRSRKERAGDAGADLRRQHRRRRRQHGAVRQLGDLEFHVAENEPATITITNSTGQTAFSAATITLKQGNASFVWDGKGNDGTSGRPAPTP